MKDSCGRTIDYLRISVTDRCNLRCKYCMPETGVPCLTHNDILTFEEILRLTQIFATQGVTKIKITGGEPLVRRGVVDLIKTIKSIKGIEKVTITTNGMLLEEYASQLVDAKIDGINISLDTLDSNTFREITLFNGLDKVLRGINKVIDLGLNLKINFVPIKDINEKDILNIALWAKDKNIQVRFIELMPMGYGKDYTMLKGQQVKDILESSYGKLEPFGEPLGNGPANYYSLREFKGKIGFINALSHEFCDSCNRLRLTADGYIKPCLFSHIDLSLKPLLRGGSSDEVLLKAVEKIVLQKPNQHNFVTETKGDNQESREMFRIGG